jgi:putative heme degradation protein
MSVSAVASWTISIPTDAAARMAARCGDDVVRLRPLWPALIAATRFARRTRWSFGNAFASLTCVEPQQRRWLTQRDESDPVQLRFDFGRWCSAYARVDGGAREIDVFAADGSPVASVRLDNIDPTLDELLWQLAADDQRPGASPAYVDARHACTLRAPYALPPGVLESALAAACDANLPLQISLRNAGGTVTWTPTAPELRRAGSVCELRSARGTIALSAGIGADQRVGLCAPYRGDPYLEALDADGAACFTVALRRAGALDRLAWRGLCADLLACQVPE